MLNLATGRNPWKSAASTDPTFQAYLQDPHNFLPTVLPISPEVNTILVRMLEVDWRRRITLAEVRAAIQGVENFYAEGVIFEGSMARCAWEVDVDLESDSDSSIHEEAVDQSEALRSHWSKESDAEMEYSKPAPVWNEEYSSCNATWAIGSSIRSPSSTMLEQLKIYEAPRTPPSTYSPLSPAPSGSLPSVPPTPEAVSVLRARPTQTPSKPLKIDTECGRRIFLAGSNGSYTTVSSMHTAVESATPFSSCFFLPTPPSVSKISLSWSSSPMPSSVDLGVYATPGSQHVDSTWEYTDSDCTSSYPSMSSDSVLGLDLDVSSKCALEDASTPHLAVWRHESITRAMNPVVPEVAAPCATRPVAVPAPTPSAPVNVPRTANGAGSEKRWSTSLWRFSFPRSSSPPRHETQEDEPRTRRGSFTDAFPFHTFFTSSPTSSWRRTPSPPVSEPSPQATTNGTHEPCHQAARPRTKRWFSPGKFFATAGAS